MVCGNIHGYPPMLCNSIHSKRSYLHIVYDLLNYKNFSDALQKLFGKRSKRGPFSSLGDLDFGNFPQLDMPESELGDIEKMLSGYHFAPNTPKY